MHLQVTCETCACISQDSRNLCALITLQVSCTIATYRNTTIVTCVDIRTYIATYVCIYAHNMYVTMCIRTYVCTYVPPFAFLKLLIPDD